MIYKDLVTVKVTILGKNKNLIEKGDYRCEIVARQVRFNEM